MMMMMMKRETKRYEASWHLNVMDKWQISLNKPDHFKIPGAECIRAFTLEPRGGVVYGRVSKFLHRKSMKQDRQTWAPVGTNGDRNREREREREREKENTPNFSTNHLNYFQV
jgi:hypothetical protein